MYTIHSVACFCNKNVLKICNFQIFVVLLVFTCMIKYSFACTKLYMIDYLNSAPSSTLNGSSSTSAIVQPNISHVILPLISTQRTQRATSSAGSISVAFNQLVQSSSTSLLQHLPHPIPAGINLITSFIFPFSQVL